mmetsp:Transcript_16620/g.14987  ORF Transcript_16620/g.14987 Transcript_16620/m.14987 type:complete len:152 (+) Transcript_16620:83-538(+)
MFTRKQLFRRYVVFKQITSKINNKCNMESFIKTNQFIEQERQVINNNIYNFASSLINHNNLITNVIESTNTTNTTIKPSKSSKRKISFSGNVKVVLIPTREEYINAKLGELIWYNSNDLTILKNNAKDEITQYVQNNPEISFKNAIKMLYH